MELPAVDLHKGTGARNDSMVKAIRFEQFLEGNGFKFRKTRQVSGVNYFEVWI